MSPLAQNIDLLLGCEQLLIFHLFDLALVSWTASEPTLLLQELSLRKE